MTAPHVSVIVPVYNGVQYIRDSISSVLGQREESFEILVWDDASTDATQEAVRSFRDPRIRVERNTTNLGLFATLNCAIKAARAPWIRLWAQDDVMKANCLHNEATYRREHADITMHFCAYERIDSSGSRLPDVVNWRYPSVIPPELANQLLFYYGCLPGNISTVAIRRDVVIEIGGFREAMRYAGDYELWTRMCAERSMGFVAEALVQIRTHAAQLSRRHGAYVDCIRESAAVVAELERRLPRRLAHEARRFNRRWRHRQYAQYLVSSLLRGDLRSVSQTFREIRRLDHPIAVFALWFFSANGRLIDRRPRFDELVTKADYPGADPKLRP